MVHRSTETFRTLHALRIKGSATTDTLAAITGLPPAEVGAHLARWSADELVLFDDARALWQLAPRGRAWHLELLRADVAPVVSRPDLAAACQRFFALDVQFRQLCTAWERFEYNGERNDHSDAGYDAAVFENLAHLHAAAEPTVAAFGDAFDRMERYGPRLESVLVRIQDGESNMFSGVMSGSYQDVWMELHEDVRLTYGLDRAGVGRS